MTAQSNICPIGCRAEEIIRLDKAFDRMDQDGRVDQADHIKDRLHAIEDGVSHEVARSDLGAFVQALILASDVTRLEDPAMPLGERDARIRRIRRLASSLATFLGGRVDAGVADALLSGRYCWRDPDELMPLLEEIISAAA